MNQTEKISMTNNLQVYHRVGKKENYKGPTIIVEIIMLGQLLFTTEIIGEIIQFHSLEEIYKDNNQTQNSPSYFDNEGLFYESKYQFTMNYIVLLLFTRLINRDKGSVRLETFE